MGLAGMRTALSANVNQPYSHVFAIVIDANGGGDGNGAEQAVCKNGKLRKLENSK